MFEDSTFESTGRIKTRSRRWMLATLILNGSIVIALILIPLIYPDALPRHMMPSLLVAPSAPTPETPPPVHVRAASPHDFSELENGRITAPPRIPIGIKKPLGPEQPFSSNIAMDLGPGVPGADGEGPFSGRRPVTVVHPDIPKSVRVSSAVIEGRLIYKNIPQYPTIAKAAGVQGTVVLQATISKTGTIENLRVVSGSPMLQAAAIDAVKTWRYRPYMLNQQAVEVDTTVNVVFSLQR